MGLWPEPAGASLPWEDSFCRLMVAGEAPRAATVLAAVPEYASRRLGPGAQVVTVFPDRMERYFSTELIQPKPATRGAA